MAELLAIMFDVIAPIFVVIGVAVFIGRRFNPDPGGLSTLLIYLFVPALVFRGISTTELSGGEIGGLVVVVVGVALTMAVLGMLAVRSGLAGLPRDGRQMEGAFILTVMLVNAANYGIPLNTFAFGQEGGQVAIIYYVISAMVGNILGVYFASRGASPREALGNVLRVPIGYAAVLGLLVNVLDVSLPLPVSRSIGIAADAAIPGMLALLGLKLSHATLRGRIRPILLATSMRLLVAPLIALPFALFGGLTGVAFRVAIVESSMPTAVLASALATEFKSDAEFTSAVTLVGTLCSVITLSVLIAVLRTAPV